MNKIEAKDRLIVALDLRDVDEARQMVERLGDTVSFYKVGLTLQLAPGVEGLIQDLISRGKKVFLDYKYYDVQETLRKAVSQAARLGISFLTVHGTGDLLTAAVSGKGNSNLKLFMVTVLTSLEAKDVAEMGYTESSVEDLVLFRTRKALEAGCDGVITSGREAQKVRELAGGKLLVVTPGIRPDGYGEDEQKRRTTPTSAIQAGADYLVIGRPITGAADPRKAAQETLVEMQQAFDGVTQASLAHS
ncbi:MAG TPA: orotidine-5'-phosphate decarboxylase [Candidatus Angelobacter sp.]|jgi:orotidine-5'-phosphate decarboxylase|nr:orotidine-5'-phosphate decarboxylase [Candidatus Angelobacter sp.]